MMKLTVGQTLQENNDKIDCGSRGLLISVSVATR